MDKRISTILFAIVAVLFIVACVDGKKKDNKQQSVATMEESKGDSTAYGVCGVNTAMHTLELVTVQGDTINYLFDVDDASAVKGGLLAGDRLAVVGYKNADGENEASLVLNLTTLMGKWRSIDKQFELMEDGTVLSAVKEEAHPWTSWKVFNGQLVLNKDTFTVNALGGDSLYLENTHGIFTFTRQK